MDFVSDQLADGRRFRAFNVVDDFTRECLAIHVERSISGALVARVLATIVHERGAPAMIVCDNGPEFISRTLELWSKESRVKLQFIQPGKPFSPRCVGNSDLFRQRWARCLASSKLSIVPDAARAEAGPRLRGDAPSARSIGASSHEQRCEHR